ncbi:MAG: hypothetical protein KAI55_02710 [Candidatus Aenigmarchaeota archaeon]|nr:hypothetical protein [Candidatus Aenigmarchaeota archaeon]
MTIDLFKKCNASIGALINDSYLNFFMNISNIAVSKDKYAFLLKNKIIVNTFDYASKYFLSKPIVDFYALENKSIPFPEFYLYVFLQNSTLLNNYYLGWDIKGYTTNIICYLNTPFENKIINFSETKKIEYVNELNKTHNIFVVCFNKTSNKEIKNITIMIPHYDEKITEQEKRDYTAFLWIFLLIIILIICKLCKNNLKLFFEKMLYRLKKIHINGNLHSLKKTINDKKLKDSWDKYKKVQEQYIEFRKTRDYDQTKNIRDDIKIIAQEIECLVKEKEKLNKSQ